MSSRTLAGLAAELEDMRRRLRALEGAPQLASSSVEDGAILVNDAAGATRAVLGKQPDGTVDVTVGAASLLGASSTATQALASANGKNQVTYSAGPPGTAPNTAGDTWWQFADGVVVGQWAGLGGTTWEARTLGHEVISSIDAAAITVGKLTGVQLAAGTVVAENLAAVLAVVFRLTSAESGRRWEADSAGIRVLDADDTLLVNFPTDPDSWASIMADLLATSLTVLDQFAMRGTGEISKGARLVLSGGTTAPTSPVSVAIDWPWHAATAGGTLAGFDPYRSGLAWWQSRWWTAQNVYGGTAILNDWAADGSGGGPAADIATNLDSAYMGVAVLGSDLWVLGTRDAGDFRYDVWLERYNTAGTRTAQWLFWADRPSFEAQQFALGSDGATLYVAFRNSVDSKVYWRTVNPSTGVVSSSQATTLTTSKEVSSLTVGTFDFGGTRMVLTLNDTAQAYVLNTAGTLQPNEHFPLPVGTGRLHTAWDSATFHTFDPAGARIYHHTGIRWTTESSLWWASSTWYDPAATGGTHETAQGTRKSFTMKKRSRLTVTAPPFPVRPIPTTTDDVTAARVYLARGASDPGRTYMELAGTAAAPSRTVPLTSFTFPAGTAVTPPPASSNFPASAPGEVTSADLSTLIFRGDGSATLGGLLITATGATTAKLGANGRRINAMDFGSSSTAFNASGQLTVNHTLGVAPSAVVATARGTLAYAITVASYTSTTITFQVVNSSHASAGAVGVPFDWIALA
jgi:hypothetical protein